MKIFHLFLLIILIYLASSFKTITKSEKNKHLSTAFLDVIQELYIDPHIEFDILIYGEVSPQIYDVINSIGKGGFLFTRIGRLNQSHGKLLNSSIIFCESLRDVKLFYKDYNGLGGINFAKNYRFLFYVHQAFNDTQIGVDKLSWEFGRCSWFSYFITKHEKEIKLQTIKWFTNIKCDEEQVATLNGFNLRLKKWMKPLENLFSYYNYHGCTLRVDSQIFRIYLVDVLEDVPMFIPLIPPHIYKIMTEVLDKRNSIEANFIQVFAQQGNFTISNDTNVLQRHMYILTTNYMFIDYTHFTTEFYQEDYTVMTTPSEEYTSYEKLVLPFDFATWMCLLTTFAIAFVVIFISGRTSKADILFGDKVTHPSLNVVGAFFGITQIKLPENNFARLLLILFVYFCLIFRTAYQGRFLKLRLLTLLPFIP